MNYDIELLAGDEVSIDTDEFSTWAKVLEVFTGGCRVRHSGGQERVYWFSRVLDVDPISPRRYGR